MNAFCASVNFDSFIGLRPPPSLGKITENSNLKRGNFVGGGLNQNDLNL